MAERVTRKQSSDGVKAERPARLEQRAERAENPYNFEDECWQPLLRAAKSKT